MNFDSVTFDDLFQFSPESPQRDDDEDFENKTCYSSINTLQLTQQQSASKTRINEPSTNDVKICATTDAYCFGSSSSTNSFDNKSAVKNKGNEYEKANQEEKTLTKRQRGHDFANVTYKIEKSRQSARQMVFDNHKNFFDT